MLDTCCLWPLGTYSMLKHVLGQLSFEISGDEDDGEAGAQNGDEADKKAYESLGKVAFIHPVQSLRNL